MRRAARCRSGQALRADLEAHHRQPDGIGRARAHHRRHRGQGRRAQARAARHRPGRARSTASSRSTRKAATTTARTRTARRLPPMSAGEPLPSASASRRPAFHRAAAALFRSQPGQADGRARHRPALDLRLDPDRAAGPRLCAASRRSASSRRTRAGWSPPSWRVLPRYVEYDFTADLEEKLDQVSNGEIDWKQRAARLLARLHRRRRRDQGSARHRRCSTRSTSCSARTSSRRGRTAPIRAPARPAAPASCR